MNLTINQINYNKKLFLKNAYELKIRFYYYIITLFITIIFCYMYSDAIIYMFVNPLLIKMNSQRFIFTSLKEILFMYFKFSFLIGFFFSLPILFLQFFLFFLNGLYTFEVKLISFFFFLSLILFLFGFFLGYTIIIPNTWTFFLEFENKNMFFPLHFEAKLNSYLFFIINLLISIVICFQIPAIFFIFFSFNLVKNIFFIKNRKLIYILSIITGTLISSPDILSQLFIWSIFICSYEISLFFLYFLIKFKNIK